MIRLYNTLTRKKQAFRPLRGKEVSFYTCGPTVYSYAHLGNLRTYVFEDVLKRVLLFNGYRVKHLMNITDVGHLTSDADTGEDKMEKAARESRRSAAQIAEFYSQAFWADCRKLNILPPNIVAKATDHIAEDIALIQTLEKNGFTYRTSDGIYFDTSRFQDYGRLTGMNFQQLNKNLKAGARVEYSTEKKHPTDFALWKFSPVDSRRQMEWPSPWGIGFPGWHIECAAINLKYLAHAFSGKKFMPRRAQTIDIHTGGVDHIPVHHTNEIAQVEAATEKKFVNFWLHGEFLVLQNERMGKSVGNIFLVKDMEEEGFAPLAFRYLVLNSHYRTPLQFSPAALQNAQESFNNIRNFIADCLVEKRSGSKEKNPSWLTKVQKEFTQAVNDDLNTPQALAAFWKMIKTCYKMKNDSHQPNLIPWNACYRSALIFDKVLGLGLAEIKAAAPSARIRALAEKRDQLRKEKKWAEADRIRKTIEKAGFALEDAAATTVIKPKIYYGRKK